MPVYGSSKCGATEDGRDCWNDIHPGSRYGLCLDHWRKAAERWYKPETARVRCRHCGQLTLVASKADRITFCINRECALVDFETPASAVRESAAPRPDLPVEPSEQKYAVVYYLKFGDRIKIGTTRHLHSRLTQIYHDECLAIEPGGRELEQSRHLMFASCRIDGQREWFQLIPPLQFHINQVRDQHGEPFEALRRWKAKQRKGAA